MRGRQPLARAVDEQPGEAARCRGAGLTVMAGSVFRQPRLDCCPSVWLDHRIMLAGVQLAFVRDLADVDRVRQDPIEVTARERPAASQYPGCRGEALRCPSEAIDGVLQQTHAAKF